MAKIALLIGINNYIHLDKLNFAANDADSLKSHLIQYCGFNEREDQIIVMNCANKVPVLDNIVAQINYLVQNHHQPELFFFSFSGHGFFHDGEDYLCAIDSKMEDLPGTAITQKFIEGAMGQIRARKNILLRDCCRNIQGRGGATVLTSQESLDALGKNIRMGGLPGEAPLHEPFNPSWCIFNSCAIGERSYEWGERKMGYFTACFCDALKTTRSLPEIIRRTQEHVSKIVYEEKNARQTPKPKMEGIPFELVENREKAAPETATAKVELRKSANTQDSSVLPEDEKRRYYELLTELNEATQTLPSDEKCSACFRNRRNEIVSTAETMINSKNPPSKNDLAEVNRLIRMCGQFSMELGDYKHFHELHEQFQTIASDPKNGALLQNDDLRKMRKTADIAYRRNDFKAAAGFLSEVMEEHRKLISSREKELYSELDSILLCGTTARIKKRIHALLKKEAGEEIADSFVENYNKVEFFLSQNDCMCATDALDALGKCFSMLPEIREAARRKQEAEEAARRKQKAEEAARRQQEEKEAARRQAEALKQEQENEARCKLSEECRQKIQVELNKKVSVKFREQFENFKKQYAAAEEQYKRKDSQYVNSFLKIYSQSSRKNLKLPDFDKV